MYKIEYLESVVKTDIPKLSQNERKKIKDTIENKLSVNPIEFGKPLQYSLKGCRRLRIGDYRVIYLIEKNTIVIVKIGHRRDVYKKQLKVK